MEKININEKFNLFDEYWQPKILGEVNDSYVKIAKLKGEFLWHSHENEEEMFYVISGQLMIKFRDQDVTLDEGEFLIIPKGVEHMPVAKKEVKVMLIEAKTTLNTGNKVNERTVDRLEKI